MIAPELSCVMEFAMSEMCVSGKTFFGGGGEREAKVCCKSEDFIALFIS